MGPPPRWPRTIQGVTHDPQAIPLRRGARAWSVCWASSQSLRRAPPRGPGLAQGITDDEIQIVALVSDLDGLRAKGLIQQPKLTTGNLLKRWQSLADDYGKINGRKVVVTPAVWDPIDATTFDKACTSATQDNQPFVVVNGNGYRQTRWPASRSTTTRRCSTATRPYGDLQKASGKNLFSLGMPGEKSGEVAANVVAKQGLVTPTAKIGILSGNEPGMKAAGDALEAAAEEEQAQRRPEGGDQHPQLRPDGAEPRVHGCGGDPEGRGCRHRLHQHPVHLEPGLPPGGQALAGRVQAVPRRLGELDVHAVRRIAHPLDAEGTPCITVRDTRALSTKDGVKKDNVFEAECRKQFDAAFNETTQPGVPAGDVTAGGVTYVEDLAPNECTIMSLLLPAIKKAGKNPTWDKVYANLIKTTQAPAAYMSNGEGSLGKGKQYFANQAHVMALNAANAQTPKDANGLFNGCPAPVNCFVPQLADGKEWFPIP